jgi:GNAT superfamily N-acetyltransferase
MTGNRVPLIRSRLVNLTMRKFREDNDYWRIRDFLREVFLINGRRELSWQRYRFDYWRWHGIVNMKDGTLETDVFIWETSDGRLGAVLNREAPGSVFLQMHPELRSGELEDEMIGVAEKHLSIKPTERRPALSIWTNSEDSLRQDVLRARGYKVFERPDSKECARWRPLDGPIPEVPPAEGYTVRALAGDEDLPGRAWASFRAFHPDDPEENSYDWEWYVNIQRAPLYRRDLDLVAVAPDGKIASFATIWFDDVTRTGAFEPVGTIPEHQRRGLSKAVLHEGLRRLRWIGATRAYVGSYTPGAHAAYEAAGFTGYELIEPWVKAS